MIDEETIDQRNDMREFRHYTIEEAPEPISAQAIYEEQMRQKKLYEKHTKLQVDIWKDIV